MFQRQKGKGKRSNLEEVSNGTTNGIPSKKLKNGDAKTWNGYHSMNYTFSEVLHNQKKQLSSIWNKNEKNIITDSDEALKDIELIREPFQCCSIKNVIQNSHDVITELIKELNDVELNDKNNDLYRFKQSSMDLKHLAQNNPHISGLRNMLSHEVRPWLEEVTGIKLNEEIDLFCANYRYTDHLLCHDDELEGRRIAFIMYFVKDWTEEDGGTLDLFKLNEQGHPIEVMKKLVPETNSLVFFEVTEKSYHQVSEILTKDKSRLSVGGWFHGEPYKRPPRIATNEEDLVAALDAEDIDEDEFYAWINPMYLDPEIQIEINTKFEETSEISLPDFLNEDKYKAVSEALIKAKSWKMKGPADSKHYEAVDPEQEDDDIIKQCIKFLRSDATFLMLSNLTGLKLHPLAPEQGENEEPKSVEDENEIKDELDEIPNEPSTSATTNNHNTNSNNVNGNATTIKKKSSQKPEKMEDPKCKIEVRKWKQGNYTLLNDEKVGSNEDENIDQFCLEGRLFFNSDFWNIEYGGFSSYVAKDEDEELLTVFPELNTLQLIYKDKQTMGFVKYVNDGINQLPNGEFHDISVSYYE